MNDTIPTPVTPKPNIPKPSIPTPNLNRAQNGPPISAVETGAMEAPIPKPQPELEEESASIEYSETLLPQRLLAGVIDSLVAAGLILLINIPLPDSLAMVSNGIAIVYLLIKDSIPFLNGQSIGKKIMKLQAVTTDGQPLTSTPLTGIKRNISSAILPLAFVELLILHSREKAENAGLRLGDDFASTKVISITSEESNSSDSPTE